MIDRASRDKAVRLLSALSTGGVTNYQLEDEWPSQSLDLAVRAVAEQMWLLYDDFPEKKLDRDSFTKDEIRLIDRCQAFLSSDLEYEWPNYSFATGNRTLMQRVFGFKKRRPTKEWEEFISVGEIEAWPFLRSSDYTSEMKSSRAKGEV